MNHKNDILASEKTLQIIKEIEANPHVTQRYLAQRLLVSLGKVNFLIKALVEKGLIEAKNFRDSRNKMVYMYLLTPEGIKTKIELTQKFFVMKLQEYEKLTQEIESYKKDVSGTLTQGLGIPKKVNM